MPTETGLNQFFTQPKLSQRVAAWSLITPGMKVLEPSAGDGSLVFAMLALGASVTAIEIDKKQAKKLEKRFDIFVEECRIKGIEPGSLKIITADFLEFKAREGKKAPFELVVMNPPYEKKRDLLHVAHALNFAPRVTCLVAGAFEHGSGRHVKVFSRCTVKRKVTLVNRPGFYGPDDKGEQPRRDYIVLDLRVGKPPENYEVHTVESERWYIEEE